MTTTETLEYVVQTLCLLPALDEGWEDADVFSGWEGSVYDEAKARYELVKSVLNPTLFKVRFISREITTEVIAGED